MGEGGREWGREGGTALRPVPDPDWKNRARPGPFPDPDWKNWARPGPAPRASPTARGRPFKSADRHPGPHWPDAGASAARPAQARPAPSNGRISSAAPLAEPARAGSASGQGPSPPRVLSFRSARSRELGHGESESGDLVRSLRITAQSRRAGLRTATGARSSAGRRGFQLRTAAGRGGADSEGGLKAARSIHSACLKIFNLGFAGRPSSSTQLSHARRDRAGLDFDPPQTCMLMGSIRRWHSWSLR